MNKIIINNGTDLPDDVAVEMIMRVIKKGRISNQHTQYAYETQIAEYHISAEQTPKGSDVFRIYKERKRK